MWPYHIVRGEHCRWSSAARSPAFATSPGAARVAAPKEQSFANADVLMLLGREREARTALETLRDTATLHMQAQRRLGLLAFNRGDYDEAQRDFSELPATTTPDSCISRKRSFPSRVRSPTPANTEKPPCWLATLLISS